MNKVFAYHELNLIAKQLLETYSNHRCFAFFASMGSGKTTLIHALCDELNSIDNVSSPTFSIINEYVSSSGQSMYHMDWYRLKNAADAFEAGIPEVLSLKNNYLFIEWPEIAIELLDFPYVKVELDFVDSMTRKITTELMNNGMNPVR